MELDKLTVEIRPRRPWEAVDLGILMGKRWWAQLLQLWIIVTLPLFTALCFLPPQWLFWQPLVLWWLKPLFERPLLFVLSQTVFGHFPSNLDAVKSFPRLALRQLLPSLTWRRLSPTRSLDLPVLQLEGLGGGKRSQRLSVLHREGTSPASALTIFGVHIEGFFALAIVSLVLIFVPREVHIPWDKLYVAKQSPVMVLSVNFFMYLSAAIVAPFYVATGFALYLNRRVRLEAWDIEIAFKRMLNKRAGRVAHSRGARNAVGKIIASLLLAAILPLLTGYAPEAGEIATGKHTAAQSVDMESAKILIEQVKKHEQFNQRDMRRYPDLPWRDQHNNDTDTEGDRWHASLRAFFAAVMNAGEWTLWTLVLGFIAFLVAKYSGWLREFAEFAGVELDRPQPAILFGLEVTRESLPGNISQAAAGLWRRDEKRRALALLYRACLCQLIERGVELRDGDTEGVCLAKAKNLTPVLPAGGADYFASLTLLWQRFAYGHVEPGRDEALLLCQRWNQVWLQGEHHVAEH